MTITETEIQEVYKKINPLIGKKAWGVSLGIGSFITMEFGKPLPSSEEDKRTHGEWHLWVYCCAWRLEEANKILAASADDRTKLEIAIQRLEGLKLCAIELMRPAWDTVLIFEQQVLLRLFSIISEDAEHWFLFTPDKNVLTIGPGTTWSYEKSDLIETSH